MNAYLIILLGSLLGMALFICVKSYYVQQSSKYALGFIDAFKVYTTKYTAPIFIGVLVVFICMFILPDVIANVSADDTTTKGKVLQNILDYLRLYSVGVGVCAQGLGFLIIRKGEKFLKDAEDKLNQTNNA